MNNKVSFILLFTSLLLSSCSTYNKVHPLSSVCSYKDGIWGNWKSTISFNSYDYSVRTHYNSQYLTVYIYKSYSHPSEYDIKIEIDKYSKKYQSEGWYSFKGKISIGKYPSFTIDTEYKDWGKTNYCDFLCDENMVKSINKNGLKGTINSFYINSNYDKVGLGFTFH